VSAWRPRRWLDHQHRVALRLGVAGRQLLRAPRWQRAVHQVTGVWRIEGGGRQLTKFFATHWAGRGIRVNTLSPGGVLAGSGRAVQVQVRCRVPLARMAEPEDLKGPLIFLASSASSYVTGHELRVDGGFTAW
jgi:hypothetical protein